MKVRQKKHRKKRLPRVWLMTDPRIDNDLLAAVQRLRFGSGVILRHYHLEPTERRALFLALQSICRRRGHMLFLAGDERTAVRWGADGFHNRVAPRTRFRRLSRSAPVHNPREIAVARRNGADILLLSPVYATATHEGERPLGPLKLRSLSSLGHGQAIIALGGMTDRKAAMLGSKILYGWAGIGAFRKRKMKQTPP